MTDLEELRQAKRSDDKPSALYDHIHMLGCQALTKAWNLGLDAKNPESDVYLTNLIDKHEQLLLDAVNDAIEKALSEQKTLRKLAQPAPKKPNKEGK